jgi:hypothetical protein
LNPVSSRYFITDFISIVWCALFSSVCLSVSLAIHLTCFSVAITPEKLKFCTQVRTKIIIWPKIGHRVIRPTAFFGKGPFDQIRELFKKTGLPFVIKSWKCHEFQNVILCVMNFSICHTFSISLQSWKSW